MPPGLKRFYDRGHLHFLTFSCHRRLSLLKSARARNLFVHELATVRDEPGYRLIGYVVMPEHVYLPIGEPPLGAPSVVLHRLKLRAARRLRKRKKRVSADRWHCPSVIAQMRPGDLAGM